MIEEQTLESYFVIRKPGSYLLLISLIKRGSLMKAIIKT